MAQSGSVDVSRNALDESSEVVAVDGMEGGLEDNSNTGSVFCWGWFNR